MANLHEDLTRLQMGLETTGGTLVAARRLIPYTSGSYEPTIERKVLDEVRGVTADFDDIETGNAGGPLDLTQELDFEHLLLAFLCGIQLVTPASVPPLETWTFSRPGTGLATLGSATVETVQTDGGSLDRDERFGFARPTSIAIEIAGETAQLSTSWMGRAPQALPSPTAIVGLSRTVIPASLFNVYVDDSWAELGDTAFGDLRSASITYDPALTPAYNLQGRSDLDLTGWYQGRFRGQLSLTLDHDTDGAAELAHWVAGDLRFIRLEAAFSANLSLTLDHCVRYIETPNVLSADNKQHTLELVGHLRADDQTERNRFAAVIKNGVGAW